LVRPEEFELLAEAESRRETDDSVRTEWTNAAHP
jgi:hypothetical protein